MKCDYCKSNLTMYQGQYVCEHCGESKQEANIALIDKQLKEDFFRSSEKLIYKHAWYYAKNYNMEFADIKSKAFEIFCEAVDRFDGRAKFITFLHHRLRTLNDYCQKEKSMTWDEPWGNISSIDHNLEKAIFYDFVERLSSDGRLIVNSILHGEFENHEMIRQRKAGKYRIKQIVTKDWGWRWSRAERVWKELELWWKKNEVGLVFE